MKKMTKLMSVLLALAMLLSMAACGSNPSTGNDGTTNPSSSATNPNGATNPTNPGGTTVPSTSNNGTQNDKTTYVVQVTSVGGIALEGVDIMIYEGTALKEIGATSSEGTYTANLKASDNYTVQLNGVPAGYAVEASYAFNGNLCEIKLASSVITGANMGSARFELGDIMYDFTFTDSDGVTHNLAETLAEKKMVMLNFWYNGCTWCYKEFPAINSVYAEYSEDIEVFALNDYFGQTMQDVIEWKNDMQLTFPMGMSPSGLGIGSYGQSGWPMTVIIDRYGMIAMAHAGAITSEYVWKQIFDHFTAEDYKQKLVIDYNDVVSIQKPTETFPGSDAINNAISQNGLNVNFYPASKETDGDSWEYIWPFVETEYDGRTCIKSSNKFVDSSFSILYADVELKAGQAVGFDYLISSELGNDYVVIIVNGQDVYQMSGYDENPQWKTCYPWVALEDGTYTVAICYIKDGSTNAGDDTIYIDDFRVIDSKDIEVDSYIPRQAAVKQANGTYSYVDVYFNETDGYYHVGSVNGPLLLANLMGFTEFCDYDYIYNMALEGKIVKNGYDYKDDLTEYAGYSVNATLGGYCTVNYELGEILKVVAEIMGFEGSEYEWLQICEYYQTYGPGNTNLEDPIKGLAPFSAPNAVLGKWVDNGNGQLVFQGANGETGAYNLFTYDRPIIPRGMFYKFTPSVSGAYRITSHTDYTDGLDAWLFTEEGFYTREPLFTFTAEERAYMTSDAINLVYYMEAGKTYYIDIAFWDVYATGYVAFDLEFLGETYDMFRLASPGYFTYIEGNSDDIIAGGITVALGNDGYYYHVKGTDGNGQPILGSVVYADFTQLTPIFSTALKDMIEAGSFNFSMDEDDQWIVTALKQNDNDIEKTKAYLRQVWGTDYDSYADAYKLDEVLAGKYHGTGVDMTEVARSFLDQMITTEGAEYGCVKVNAELAQLLQMLMDKFTFEGVEYSWLKLCYYYDYMGR